MFRKYNTNIDAHKEVVSLLKNNFKVDNEKLIERLNRMHKLNTTINR